MKLFVAFLLLPLFLISCQPGNQNNSDVPQRPFPQAIIFNDAIKPDLQNDLNAEVAAYYDYWKSRYLKPGVYIPNTFFVQGENTGGSITDKGTSEGHGWGMIITALMAGHDPDAKKYFDGLVRMYNATRSKHNPYLMAWLITAKEDAGGNRSSATDGDFDVAYGLLLAHEQWGSDGEFNYLEKAIDMITNGIKVSLIDTESRRLRMGDAPTMPVGTRSSDWMAGHLRAFYHYTGEKIFLEAVDTIYSMIEQITRNFSPHTGLMPDFVAGFPAGPAGPEFLETEYDGTFNWNACRFPLRLAVEFAHHGTPQARDHLNKMLAWLQPATGNNVANVRPGYFLTGEPIPGRDYYTSMAYTAPFVAASIAGAHHQQWLNEGWNHIKNVKISYYPDTINLLSMLLISGNWWAPGN
ncbi:MAG TPA: glycosyl hydrolase family 8 [Bacteroidales bacterium]|nr:glycosyl hydrolase family 8 [Bacteroidales bacterium]